MQKKNKQDVIYTYTLGLHQNKKKLNEIKKAEVTAMSDEAKKTVEPVVVVMDLGWGNTKYGYFVNGELIKDVMPSRVVESNDGLELIKIKNTTYDFRSDSTLVEIEDKVTKETTSHKLLAQKVLYEVHKKFPHMKKYSIQRILRETRAGALEVGEALDLIWSFYRTK